MSTPIIYFSTHNALRTKGEFKDQTIDITLMEINGAYFINLRVFIFYDIHLLKRLICKRLELSEKGVFSRY